jgi:hypothetical protein
MECLHFAVLVFFVVVLISCASYSFGRQFHETEARQKVAPVVLEPALIEKNIAVEAIADADRFPHRFVVYAMLF